MSDPVSPRENSSRQRFLEAADDQFIAHGYDRCTIRAIAAKAGTSLASLTRNWKGKKDLFSEVFQRHFDPVHSAQNERFDVLERSGDLSVRSIAEAFFCSAFGKSGGDGNVRRSHLIYCLALTDPSEEARAIARSIVMPVRARVTDLFRRALPDMEEQRFFLAMNLVFGSYIYTQMRADRLADAMNFDISTLNWEEAGATLADLVSSGLTQG
ncbi:MAG: TetR/AcrR family transcriptional regulator [Sphingomonadales bacterium]|nr:MAG: TetR/AcrR family transcriptional regulator [Sphingomonadales bacterium]TNF05743.1 MAG: TetR/AcrR family transcriptional regulator [Sphingomonadales bacterium]